MRSILTAILIVVLFSYCTGEKKTPEASAAPPNVILVMTDDQGYGDLGCHGNKIIKTPNLDNLYSQSTRLTNFYAFIEPL